MSWSWKYVSPWKSAVRWTCISSPSPGQFPNIYISSHCFTLILLFPSQFPAWNFNKTPPQKLLPILLVLIIFINRKWKSGIALSGAENYGFHSMSLKTTPYVQSAECQRQHLVLNRGRKNDCKWDSICGASRVFQSSNHYGIYCGKGIFKQFFAEEKIWGPNASNLVIKCCVRRQVFVPHEHIE